MLSLLSNCLCSYGVEMEMPTTVTCSCTRGHGLVPDVRRRERAVHRVEHEDDPVAVGTHRRERFVLPELVVDEWACEIRRGVACFGVLDRVNVDDIEIKVHQAAPPAVSSPSPYVRSRYATMFAHSDIVTPVSRRRWLGRSACRTAA